MQASEAPPLPLHPPAGWLENSPKPPGGGLRGQLVRVQGKHEPSRPGHLEGDAGVRVALMVTVRTRDPAPPPRATLALPRPLRSLSGPCFLLQWGWASWLVGYCPCPSGTRRAQPALVTGHLLQTNLQGLADALRGGGGRCGQGRSPAGWVSPAH